MMLILNQHESSGFTGEERRYQSFMEKLMK